MLVNFIDTSEFLLLAKGANETKNNMFRNGIDSGVNPGTKNEAGDFFYCFNNFYTATVEKACAEHVN
ncbi:MAG: hypothetical protein Kow0042_15460 [Calditrichia bacterium]